MTSNSIDLTGKVAFVTGASRGIGAATARTLASAGARVALAARSVTDIRAIAEDIGEAALPVGCDVSRADEVRDAIESTVAHFGTLDIVINNAGTIDPVARLEDSVPASWDAVVDVNLKGVYHVMHAAHPALKRGGGVIVNLSSGAAVNALEGWSHYCATKAAVQALTRCGHREWAEQGIRVVGLSPGTVATDMQGLIRDSGVNAVSQLDWSAHIGPDEAARAILYLCSDAAGVHDGKDFSIKTAEGRREAGLAARP